MNWLKKDSIYGNFLYIFTLLFTLKPIYNKDISDNRYINHRKNRYIILPVQSLTIYKEQL